MISRWHRSGNRWQLGGRTTLEDAQAECRWLWSEPQDWHRIEPAAGGPPAPPGQGPTWSTETAESLEWLQIEEVEG
jgi:hypothetical protein